MFSLGFVAFAPLAARILFITTGVAMTTKRNEYFCFQTTHGMNNWISKLLANVVVI